MDILLCYANFNTILKQSQYNLIRQYYIEYISENSILHFSIFDEGVL